MKSRTLDETRRWWDNFDENNHYERTTVYFTSKYTGIEQIRRLKLLQSLREKRFTRHKDPKDDRKKGLSKEVLDRIG